MDFSSLKPVKAEPPAGTGPAASGNSPLQPALMEARKDEAWRAFKGISVKVVGTRKNKSDGKTVEIKEYQALCDELKRAARQLEYGINIRVKFADDNKSADVFFKVGDKRKYERRNGDNGDNGNNGNNG